MNPTDINDPEYFHRVIDCQFACPAHTPVPEYIRLIAEKKYAQAYMLNWESNVFPGILGRVCDRPCEPACRRTRVEEKAVAICRLKRVCADNKGDVTNLMPGPPPKKNGKKIALIGGGPASLTVARDLVRLGYTIDLYDDQLEAGGFVRSQVPSFRLPKKVLDQEVNAILNMGVNTHLNTYIPSMKEFLAKGHDAVFVGTGAPRGRDLDLPGRKAAKAFVHVGIEWLAGVQYGHTKKTGKTTLVIGGGNTAMDCCRTARRLGGKKVKVIIRGGREQMKASPWEIEDAVREDIPILEHLSPVDFVMKGKVLKGMNFKQLLPDKAEGELLFIPCDEVLLAVGQQNAFPWIEKDIGLTFDDQGRPRVDELTFQSDLDHVFFGGDAAFGPKNVITAVAHGHEAALSIDLFCNGKDLKKRPLPVTTLAGQKMGMKDWLYNSQVSDKMRHPVPMVSKVKSIKDRLLEVELGFNPKVGSKESLRCLNCDIQTVFTPDLCIECDACVDVCPTTCINFVKNKDEQELRSSLGVPAKNESQPLYVSDTLATGRVMVKDEDLCLHCGLCAERCPTAAWDMQKYTYNPPKAGQK
ncbi:MAG: FAD-dependent oxidoreductase [Desulfobacter sp.]|nr:FAD-dependent oxidoreductase [Desulfobacter sp.]WDP86061.1 MAG: FAD-dependent oxidoreductase [Desulfobacter sp.]